MGRHFDKLINLMGGLGRSKPTPLSIAFVAHLRTFLMDYLLSMLYLHGHLWGWGTIPAFCLTECILLGIDASALECESLFKSRPNQKLCSNVLYNSKDLHIENAEGRLAGENYRRD